MPSLTSPEIATGQCLFTIPAETLEADAAQLAEYFGEENVYNSGGGNVCVHCPQQGCRGEIEQKPGAESKVDYTLGSIGLARYLCIERNSNG